MCLSASTFDDHLEKLNRVFNILSNAGLRIQTKKCTFCAPEVEYLGYLITRNGIKPCKAKVEAINNLAVPKTVRDVRRILGIINFYRDMWPKRSETLAPMTDLIGDSDKLSKTKSEKKTINSVK